MDPCKKCGTSGSYKSLRDTIHNTVPQIDICKPICDWDDRSQFWGMFFEGPPNVIKLGSDAGFDITLYIRPGPEAVAQIVISREFELNEFQGELHDKQIKDFGQHIALAYGKRSWFKVTSSAHEDVISLTDPECVDVGAE